MSLSLKRFVAALFLLLPLTAVATPAAPLTFAVIGDYGNNSPDEAAVAALVDSWNPDLILTVGDNNYEVGAAATIDDNIGQYYADYISPYTGSYGPGAATNQFWPSLGNHDWFSLACTGTTCTGPYFDYFTLPGNERYYDFVQGNVHFFAIDSDGNEPDGVDSASAQALWLQSALAAAPEPWKIVYFHHSPYSSSTRPDVAYMRWPFAAWGATAVLYGHEHFYERLKVDDIPYIVTGAGGRPLYNFGVIDPQSIVRYNDDHGALKVTATDTSLTFTYFNESGQQIDTLTVYLQPTAVKEHYIVPQDPLIPLFLLVGLAGIVTLLTVAVTRRPAGASS